MAVLNLTEARKRLYRLVDEALESREPITIVGTRGNAVLLSQDDWRAIQESLHLLAVPGMRESIPQGMATPVGSCSEESGW